MRRLIRLALLGGLAAALWIWLRELLDQSEGAQPTPAPREEPASPERGEGRFKSVSKAELYRQAQELDIEGRSKMTKEELAAAVAAARGKVPA